jgi:plasmid stabilization system protein ParE
VKRFVLTPVAEGDLRDIHQFLIAENPNAAERVRNALLDAMRLLADRPSIGHLRTDSPTKRFGSGRFSLT